MIYKIHTKLNSQVEVKLLYQTCYLLPCYWKIELNNYKKNDPEWNPKEHKKWHFEARTSWLFFRFIFSTYKNGTV